MPKEKCSCGELKDSRAKEMSIKGHFARWGYVPSYI